MGGSHPVSSDNLAAELNSQQQYMRVTLTNTNWGTIGESLTVARPAFKERFDLTGVTDAPWGSGRGIGTLEEWTCLKNMNNSHRIQICAIQYTPDVLHGTQKIWMRQTNSSNSTWTAWKEL